MKQISFFIAGMLVASAFAVAAECIRDGDLTPMVRVSDARTGKLLLVCRMMITMIDGHELKCDRETTPAR